jgi:hypothetical protein
VASGSVGSVSTATSAATDGADTTAATLASGIDASSAVTEGQDLSAAALATTVAFAGAQTEGTDTSTANLNVATAFAGAQTEGFDISVALGTVQQGSYTINSTRANLIYELALLHGLVPGNPLTVTATQRNAGALTQTISGTGTVTITTTSSDVIQGSLDTWIDALAAVHGLTAPLVVTATSRDAGSLHQTLANDGTTTTVTT